MTSDSPVTPAAPLSATDPSALLGAFVRRQFFNDSVTGSAVVNQFANGQVTGHITVTDPSGDAVSFTSLPTTSLRGGTVAVDASTGNFTYTPTADLLQYGGLDKFTVTASDDPNGTTFYGPVDMLTHIPVVGAVIGAVAQATGLLPAHTSQVPVTVTVFVPSATATGWPVRPVTDLGGLKVNDLEFMPAEQLQAWHEYLDGVGLRATGSAAHEGYIDTLVGMLGDAGIQDVQTQSFPVTRWTTNSWTLNLVNGDTVTPVNAPAYMPYSGVTSADGVTAPLFYLSSTKEINPADVVGKIVVFDVPLTELPEPAFLLLQYPGKVYDPANSILTGGTYKRPYLNGLVPVIDQLQAAGALGAVGVLDYPQDAVTGSYFPYDGVLRDIPGVFVDRQVGAELKAQAQQGVSANIALPATVAEVSSRNIIATIPGKNYGAAADEVVIIQSHTDGTNGLEDNGPYMITAMAQYLNRLPQDQRDATFVVLLSSGHFVGGEGLQAFAADPQNAELIARTKAAMTIEHVGALEYTEVDGTMQPTGNAEPGVWWSRNYGGLVQGAFNQLVDGGLNPGGVLHGLGDALGAIKGHVPTGVADDALWPGDGQYLQAAGIPDINYITGPTYLLNWGITTVDKVDFSVIRQAAIAATDQALYYGRTPKDQLLAPTGLFGLGYFGL
ncbi:MAG: Ig-like domain-containing protein [Mycobacterium sp.]